MTDNSAEEAILLVCERCGKRTAVVAISIAHEAVCLNCLNILEDPELKFRVSNTLENKNIYKVIQYLVRNRRKR